MTRNLAHGLEGLESCNVTDVTYCWAYNCEMITSVTYSIVIQARRQRQKVKQAVREAPIIFPAPCNLTFDLLTLKVTSESRVTWATSVPILVFLGHSVLNLGQILDLAPMYATNRCQTVDVRQTSDAHHRLMPLPQGRGIICKYRSTSFHSSAKYNCKDLLIAL